MRNEEHGMVTGAIFSADNCLLAFAGVVTTTPTFHTTRERAETGRLLERFVEKLVVAWLVVWLCAVLGQRHSVSRWVVQG